MRTALLMLLVACRTPSPQEPSREDPTPWCFRLELRRNERWELGSACSETMKTCRHAAAQARRWAGIAQLKNVGECKETP